MIWHKTITNKLRFAANVPHELETEVVIIRTTKKNLRLIYPAIEYVIKIGPNHDTLVKLRLIRVTVNTHEATISQ